MSNHNEVHPPQANDQPVPQQPGSPTTQYGPAPVAPQTPYQQQPVNQQYFAQPQAAPVQYVVSSESLKGVKGWLLFFVICFAIGGLINIMTFFQSLNSVSVTNITTVIFSPILAILAISAVVTVAMQKKLGKWLAVSLYGFAAVSTVTNTVIGYVRSGSDNVATLIGTIIAMLVGFGLIMLYFFVSRRVKETLVL